MTKELSFSLGLLLGACGSLLGFLLAMAGDSAMRKGALVGLLMQVVAVIITLCIVMPMMR